MSVLRGIEKQNKAKRIIMPKCGQKLFSQKGESLVKCETTIHHPESIEMNNKLLSNELSGKQTLSVNTIWGQWFVKLIRWKNFE